MLQTYIPQVNPIDCSVTITEQGFRFSVEAAKRADLDSVQWMRLHTDPDDRLIVFEPVPGLDRQHGVLKLGTYRKHSKSVIAKGLITQYSWIKAITELPSNMRVFELKPYPGQLPQLDSSGEIQRRSLGISS